jgi:hypothetical protein
MSDEYRRSDGAGSKYFHTHVDDDVAKEVIPGSQIVDNQGDEILGKASDAAVDTDAAASISARLRGLVKLVIAQITVKLGAGTAEIGNVKNSGTFAVQESGFSKGSGNVDSGTVRVITAADGPLNTAIGTTSEAAITTDTTGSISGKLRGMIKLFVDKITVKLDTGTNIIGAVKDAGPNSRGTDTYTTSADMSTAAAIAPAPTAGQYSVLKEIDISAGVAMEFSLQEETSATVRRSYLLPANGTLHIVFRDEIKLATTDKRWFGKASVAGSVRIGTVVKSEA